MGQGGMERRHQQGWIGPAEQADETAPVAARTIGEGPVASSNETAAVATPVAAEVSVQAAAPTSAQANGTVQDVASLTAGGTAQADEAVQEENERDMYAEENEMNVDEEENEEQERNIDEENSYFDSSTNTLSIVFLHGGIIETLIGYFSKTQHI